jgi:hypothetical protein
MDIQHVHGHAAWTRTGNMDMDMQHRHTVDMPYGLGHAA